MRPNHWNQVHRSFIMKFNVSVVLDTFTNTDILINRKIGLFKKEENPRVFPILA